MEPTIYPCVPGHEIVGRVTKVGTAVTKFKTGDLAAVGCLVDSDGNCQECQAGLEQFCPIPIQKVNEAYERMSRADVKYRFSIDMAKASGVTEVTIRNRIRALAKDLNLSMV